MVAVRRRASRSPGPFGPPSGLILTSSEMSSDPWSRPTLDDLRHVLESIGKSEIEHDRNAERLDLSVPAEIQTSRGNTVAAMTREISRYGIGMLHRGYVTPGDITVRMASETRQFEYRVKLEWCMPCDNGMFISGGRFLSQKSMTS